jgi:hypothetical protein
MAQTKFAGVKSHEQLDAIVANKVTTQLHHSQLPSQTSIQSQDETEAREKWTPDEDKLAKLYQVDQLINRKYKKQTLTGTQSSPSFVLVPIGTAPGRCTALSVEETVERVPPCTVERVPPCTVERVPFRQIVEMAMLFKVSSETDFFRRLQMTETGRLFDKQIENCLQTLQITLEMSSEAFQSTINHLTQESKDTVLSSRRTN